MQMQDSTHPTGVTADSDRGSVIRARDRKANAAVELKLSGASWEDIAEVLGFPTPRAARVAVERALEKQLRDDPKSQAHMRELAGRRLERLLRAVWSKAIDPGHPDHLLAVTKAREVIDRHAKLYGLDAPAEVVIHSPTQSEIEAWVSQVASVASPKVEEYDIFDAEWDEEEDQKELEAGAVPSE